MDNARWVAVVPIKVLERAKTRLRGAVPDAIHPDLVLAMAMDTIAAAAACASISRIVVVTDDARVRAELRRPELHYVPDLPAAGLNAALRFGASGIAGPVVALTADLPALRTTELSAALRQASPATADRTVSRAFVADAAGTGTVLLTAGRGAELDPRFGPASATSHRTSGATELGGDWPSLRRDVDTTEDLAVAAALGLGPATTALLASTRVPPR